MSSLVERLRKLTEDDFYYCPNETYIAVNEAADALEELIAAAEPFMKPTLISPFSESWGRLAAAVEKAKEAG